MHRYWLVALALPALAAACGGSDDTNALRTQVAALQTQSTEPTATSTPIAPPTVDTRAFCRALSEFMAARKAVVDKANEFMKARKSLTNLSSAEVDQLQTLGNTETGVQVPLPPKGAEANISRLNTLVFALKSADDTILSALTRGDAGRFGTARAESNALGQEFDQLIAAECR